MILTPKKSPRPGVTLIEVLVAIFVASIGLLALLALFPVGALSMKQALKDSRCAQTAANATALFRARSIGLDSAVVSDYSISATTIVADSFKDGITTLPNGYNSPLSYLGTRSAITSNGPSYPVYVDPLGVLKGQNHLPIFNDTKSTSTSYSYPRIPRHSISLFSTNPSIPLYENTFTLLDDIYFDSQGTNAGAPQLTSGLVFQRESRYTFAYLLKRPYALIPSTFDVTVVVYSGRPLLTSTTATDETGYFPITFNTASTALASNTSPTSVDIPYEQLGVSRPSIKPGSWILDATMLASDLSTPEPHGYFYRVLDVIDGFDSNTPPRAKITLELQTIPRQSTTVGQLIILDNVVEVFEKGTVSLP